MLVGGHPSIEIYRAIYEVYSAGSCCHAAVNWQKLVESYPRTCSRENRRSMRFALEQGVDRSGKHGFSCLMAGLPALAGVWSFSMAPQLV